MNPDFILKVRREEKTRPVSEIPSGVIDMSSAQMIIPECCREGWPSCPHVAKKQKVAKRNIGL